MQAVVVNDYGGPEVLEWESFPDPVPGPADAIVRVTAAGVNFVDTYYRSGEYRGSLPMIPGMEAEGLVEAVGFAVDSVRPGDRVAFAMHLGAYSELVRLPAERLVSVPDHLAPNLAAAGLLQAMTAHFLTNDLYVLRPGQFVLVHAAAGGLGQLLVQLLLPLDVCVIGTVSTEAKADIARRVGVHHVVNYSEQDFAQEVGRITGGRGVAVAFDSVGKDTWARSLSCIQPRGMLVLSGQSSGPAGPVDPQQLRVQGSVLLARPSLSNYIATRPELLSRAHAVLDDLAEGRLRVEIAAIFPLNQAAAAHRLLESRQAHGKILLCPQPGWLE